MPRPMSRIRALLSLSHASRFALPREAAPGVAMPGAPEAEPPAAQDPSDQAATALPPRVLLFGLPLDGLLCFAARCMRMFSYGAIAPVLFLFCVEIGLTELDVGALLTCIMLGDLVITLGMTTRADGFGRRRTLVVGAALKVIAGGVFGVSRSFGVLVAAGIVGVISTSGGECGPFIAVEQAALTDAVLACRAGSAQATGAAEVAVLFGWYNALGYWAQAAGAVASGLAVRFLQRDPGPALTALEAYRCVFFAYAATGSLMGLAYACLSAAAEAKPGEAAARGTSWTGLRRPGSLRIVARLSAFFAMDAFGGAFTMQTFVAFWFSERWSFASDRIGELLGTANVVAGASGVAASYFVRKIGAMETMIVTHLPSNVLLLAVPFMPTANAAAAMLVARFCISQMDVPARQAYVAMVVASDERSAAGGITNIVRSLGMSAAPLLLGYLSSAQPRTSLKFSSPWLISGGVKIAYDIGLFAMYRFSRMRSDEVGAEPAPDALREPLLQAEAGEGGAAEQAASDGAT